MTTTTPRTRAKKGMVVAALSVALLFLTGCFRMDMNFELHENNTADLTMEVVDTSGFLFDPEYGGGSCDDLFGEMGTDVPDGGEFKSEEFTTDDDKKGCLMSMTGAPLDEVISDVSEEGGIQRVGDEFIIELPADPSGTEEISSLPGVEISVSFTFPGEVIEAGGGTVSEDGRTVTFVGTSAFTDGVNIKGSAVGDSNNTVTMMLAILGVLIVAGIIGGILVFVSRKKNNTGDAQGHQGYQGMPASYQQPQQNYDPSNPYAEYSQQPGQSQPQAPNYGNPGTPLPPAPPQGQPQSTLPPPPPSAPSPDTNPGEGNDGNREWNGNDWDSPNPR